jgi:hypothetical protein
MLTFFFFFFFFHTASIDGSFSTCQVCMYQYSINHLFYISLIYLIFSHNFKLFSKKKKNAT